MAASPRLRPPSSPKATGEAPARPRTSGGAAAFFLLAATLFLGVAFSRGTPAEALLFPWSSSSRAAKSASSSVRPLPVRGRGRFIASSSSSAAAVPVSSQTGAIAVLREAIRKNGGKGLLDFWRSLKRAAPADTPPPVRSDNRVGTYLTYGSTANTAFVRKTIDAIADAGGDALVFEVKGGYVHFQTDAPMAQKLGLVVPSYDIAAVVALAKEKGLYTIARYVAVKDPLLAERQPSTCIRNPVSGVCIGTAWTDPSAPDTLTYNKEIIEDLLASGVDEINFDYIRYPTENALAAVGLTGAEKADHLEAFLKMAKDLRDTVSPATKLGISTYAILGWDFEANFTYLGQDISRFAPLLDVISPMAYPASFSDQSYQPPKGYPRTRAYYLVYQTLVGYTKLLGPEQSGKVRPWIQAAFLSPTEIRDEIDAVYDAGSCGFTFWSAGNIYTNAYAGMKLAAKDRPERCMD